MSLLHWFFHNLITNASFSQSNVYPFCLEKQEAIGEDIQIVSAVRADRKSIILTLVEQQLMGTLY